MTHLPRYIFTLLATIPLFSALILGFLATFIRTAGPGNLIYDGLGRTLHITPMIVRIFTSTDSMWAGWTWAVVDWGVTLALIVLGYILFRIAGSFEK